MKSKFLKMFGYSYYCVTMMTDDCDVGLTFMLYATSKRQGIAKAMHKVGRCANAILGDWSFDIEEI